jgi:hypothetical protein
MNPRKDKYALSLNDEERIITFYFYKCLVGFYEILNKFSVLITILIQYLFHHGKGRINSSLLNLTMLIHWCCCNMISFHLYKFYFFMLIIQNYLSHEKLEDWRSGVEHFFFFCKII